MEEAAFPPRQIDGVELSRCSSEDPLKNREKGKEVDKDIEQQDSEEAHGLADPGWARPVATLIYLCVALGHLILVKEQCLETQSDGALFVSLAVLQVSLGFEATVYAVGGLVQPGGVGFVVNFLESAGRFRLLLGATVWAWLVPWAAEVHCRCGEQPPRATAVLAHQQGQTLACFVSAYFALREVCVLLRGEPPSALDRSVQPRFGDCLPSNALLGGQFRMDKAEFEQTGRTVFVPARLRAGLDTSSGLALAAHFASALALHQNQWLLATLLCLLARRLGGAWEVLLGRRGAWAREVPRLLCRFGELWWLRCALWQLQLCELDANGQLPQCALILHDVAISDRVGQLLDWQHLLAEKAMPEIWLEKYRPIKFEDVVGNSAAVTILRSHATAGTFPHLLLTGPPGCGKTTVVHCLAREHLQEHYEQGCIELNASDDRGIDVVREKIKGFAQQKVSLPEGKLKVIILDEADSMTQAAQQAMRRTMEIFSETTRFALACNISSKIIEPIQSRCAILRFSRISDEDMLQRLKLVLEKEGAPYDQSGLEALAFSAEGDMRNALNGAQSTFNAFGEINKATVFRMNDQPQPEKVKSCLEASLKKDAKGTFGPMHEIWNQGYSTTDIISTFSRVAKQMEAPEHIKLEWLKEIGLAHARVTAGAQNLLQLDAMVSKIILASERG
ncbi:Replication factor C subunit 2 [Symbiodinium microadriaticum]|uniref:Replication factor C subunit 2 n=1 Tax=Symbiodinium microadriaticum TaxID=2951 RepID=A0A1Q9CQX2_SYMMI|nr:Replication factor C subunit 2 [Symbiodinium microadriaticum]